MIKARCTGAGGRKTLLLGIDGENWKRLRDGKPIHINGEEVGMPDMDVLIIGATTMKSLVNQIQPFVGPETVVHNELKGRGRH